MLALTSVFGTYLYSHFSPRGIEDELERGRSSLEAIAVILMMSDQGLHLNNDSRDIEKI